jgi:hypothetical protein
MHLQRIDNQASGGLTYALQYALFQGFQLQVQHASSNATSGGVPEAPAGAEAAVVDTEAAASTPEQAAPAISEELRARIMGTQRAWNWNGQRARAVKRASCELAVSLVADALARGVPAPRSVAPSPWGAVTMQWVNGPRMLLVAIDVATPDELHFQWEGPQNAHDHGRVSREEALDRLLELYNTK